MSVTFLYLSMADEDFPFYLLDVNPERFDRQTQGVVVAYVDETDRSRPALQNGGPVLILKPD